MTLREALLSMNYREQHPQIWSKPVGFHLFTFSEAKNLWQNWFLGRNKKLLVWVQGSFNHDIPDYPYIDQLKTFECTPVEHCLDSSFEIPTVDI